MSQPQRRNIKVTAINPVPADSDVRMIYVGDGFHLLGGGMLLATCPGAKRLSDYAFAEGAKSVRCDFHWGLADGEL